MKINKTSVSGRLVAGFAISCFFLPVQFTAQINLSDSLKYKDIEVVKITKLNAADKNRSKITTSDSDLLNHDAGKFLNVIPEISGIKKAGNYATDPVLRGFKYEQLNIIIDGAANAIHACPSRMDPAVSQVNMNMVQEAEIFKGPYHFRNGNSFGGTINFITLAPVFSDKPKLSGRLSTGFESNGNVVRNEAYTGLVSKNMVWNLFGSYQKGERYSDGNSTEVRSGFLRYNIGTKGILKWNDNHLTTLQVSANQGRNVEFAALQMDLIYDKTLMLQLKDVWKFRDSFFNQLDFNSYYSAVDHAMGTPDRKMISDVNSMAYGGRGELKKQWSGNVLYTGFDYKHEAAHNLRMVMPPMMKPRDGTSWQDSFINQFGWFGEYQRLFPQSKLTASARLDYNYSDTDEPSQLFKTLYDDLSSQNLNHNLSLGYSTALGNSTQIALWAGRAQRSGSLTERYMNLFPVGNDSYEILGNPELKPETNNQADLIFSLRKKDVFFQTDVFYSFLQNYISGVIRSDIKPYSMASPGVRQMQNVKHAVKAGFESKLNWVILPDLRSEMAVAYTYARDLETAMPLPEIFPLDFRWRIEADFSPLILGADLRAVSGQKRINTDFGEMETPGFQLVNLTARYEIFTNAFLNAEVSNLFNQAYAEHLNRTLSNNKNSRILERGRSLNMGFSYAF